MMFVVRSKIEQKCGEYISARGFKYVQESQ